MRISGKLFTLEVTGGFVGIVIIWAKALDGRKRFQQGAIN